MTGMKVRSGFLPWASAVLLWGCAHASAAPDDLAGDWMGKLSFSGFQMRIVFHIASLEDGTLEATLDSPDQGAAGIPASSVSFDGDSLIIEVAVTQGGYYGRYDSDSLFVDGEWRQSGLRIPLRLVRGGEIEPPRRPQMPERPLPYHEKEIEFENADAAITLAGTVTIPEGDGPFPAAVLVSGSGAQDRDETILGHKPFLVLSDHLTRSGIAVLRYDDRGVGGSGGSQSEATTEDFASDAMAAFSFLKGLEEVDPARTGIIGHSEGGIIAAMAASRSPEIAFIVMLAGPGLKGSQVLHDQNMTMLEMLGAPPDLIERRSRQLKGEYEILAASANGEGAVDAIVKFSLGFQENYSPEEREKYGFNRENIELRAKTLATPWFRFFMEYDPADALRKTGCPVLAMVGEKDMQVDPKRNLPAIEAALQAAGNGNCTIVEMAGLNHLFQTAETGSPMEYSKIEETISPAALETVSGWILSISAGGKR